MFDKNLQALNNEALKRRLAKVDILESRSGITYLVTESKDYIILKDDVPIDDLNNPREAIKKNLKSSIKSEMKQNDIIITFGIGLGYLLDEVYNTYPSKIFVYEPDINILHFVLNNVDISEHLSSGRVYISNDLDELLTKLSSVYLTKDKVEIVYLQNYAFIRNKELLMLTQKVFETCKSKLVDISTIAKFSERWLVNTLDNISAVNKNECCLLSDLEDKFIGQTALLLGAGPSLNDNIEKIKANRGSFVIFAVNKITRYLEEHNIIPEFIVCLDAGNMEKTLSVSPEYLAKTNCLMDIRVDRAIFNKKFKRVFVNFSNTDSVINKLAQTNSFIKMYESGGTSTILALVSAVKMGFSKIVLAGIDLAFKDNIIYADGETLNRVSQDEIIVDSVKKNLVQVKSVNGGTVYTRDDYQAFIHQFGEVIKTLGYENVYNISDFGADINGVKPVNFTSLNLMTPANLEILDEVNSFKFKLEEFIQDEFLQINNIISLLSKDVFSPALVSAIIKSVLIYQFMQADILTILQNSFDQQTVDTFINKTKGAIKTVVDILQRNQMV